MIDMSDLTVWVTVMIFGLTIMAVVMGKIDSSVSALAGVLLMIWFQTMSVGEAFNAVDWNVMAILVSIWIIAEYLGKTGIPEWLSIKALDLSGGKGALLVMILSLLAGIISLVVDNVVVILMMAPVAIPIVRHLNLPLAPVILMIGFSSNFFYIGLFALVGGFEKTHLLQRLADWLAPLFIENLVAGDADRYVDAWLFGAETSDTWQRGP